MSEIKDKKDKKIPYIELLLNNVHTWYNCTYQNLSQPMTSYPTGVLDTPQESLGTFIPHEDDCYDAGSVQIEACQIHLKSPCRRTHGQQEENQIYGDIQL